MGSDIQYVQFGNEQLTISYNEVEGGEKVVYALGEENNIDGVIDGVFKHFDDGRKEYWAPKKEVDAPDNWTYKGQVTAEFQAKFTKLKAQALKAAAAGFRKAFKSDKAQDSVCRVREDVARADADLEGLHYRLSFKKENGKWRLTGSMISSLEKGGTVFATLPSTGDKKKRLPRGIEATFTGAFQLACHSGNTRTLSYDNYRAIGIRNAQARSQEPVSDSMSRRLYQMLKDQLRIQSHPDGLSDPE